jgi:phage gpG-like protein
MGWQVVYDPSEANAMLQQLEQNLATTGVEKVAAKAADELLTEAHGSFGTKADPMRDTAWAPPAAATVRDKGFKSLLVRSGQLEGALVSGYQLTPAGATAFLNVQASQIGLALIHLYGVQAKKRRTYMRSTPRGFKKESRPRLRPAQAMPARGFVGIPPEKIAELTTYTEQVMVP